MNASTTTRLSFFSVSAAFELDFTISHIYMYQQMTWSFNVVEYTLSWNINYYCVWPTKTPSQLCKMYMYNQCLLETQFITIINMSFWDNCRKIKYIYKYLYKSGTVKQFNSTPAQVFNNNIPLYLMVKHSPVLNSFFLAILIINFQVKI